MSQPVQVQVFRDGQLTGHVVLDGMKKVNKIGKTSSSQIKLDDPQASRVHAVIEVSRTGAWLIDMGSAVGTLLNGKRVNKARLNTGDQITIGSSVLVITIGAELAAPPPMQVVAPQPMPTATPQPMPVAAPQAAPPILPQQAAQPMPAMPQAAPPIVAPQPAAQPMSAAAIPPAAPMSGPPPSSLGPLQPMAQAAPRPAAFGPPPPVDVTVRDTDGALSDTDPAVMRLQKSARRNRMIGGSVIVGVVVVTAAFVYLGKQGDGPDLMEPSNYSDFGVKEGEIDIDVDAATDPAADDAAGDAGADPAADAADAAADAADAAADAADPAADAADPVDDAADPAAEPAEPAAAYDVAAARDEAAYVYEKLTIEQTFAALAQRHYGDPVRATLVAEANPLAAADQAVSAGTEVRVPRFVIHEVAPGNTLGGIAKIYFGDGKLYEKVFAANRDLLSSPTAIDVGMKLKIPIIKE